MSYFYSNFATKNEFLVITKALYLPDDLFDIIKES